jgi:tape measure domain-containing protein
MAQNIVFKISADTSNFDEGMKKTGVEVDAVNKKTKQATAEVGQFQKALGNIGGMVAGAFAVSSLIAFGKEVAKTRAEIESLTTRIADIKGGQEAGNRAMEDLRQTANQLGLEFKELASNYTAFVGGAKASGMEIGKAEKVFKSMTIAIKGSGASAEQSRRAFTALTQIISKNSIMAEELRGQLAEALPSAVGIMAKSLNVSTAELGKMMERGELIASEVLPKFAKEMENTFGANAQKMASGLSSEIARMGNKWDELLETVGRTGIIEGTVSLLTAGIEGLSASVAMLTLQWGEYQQAVINAERALQLDAEGKRIDAQIQKRIETLKQAGLTEDEINQELTASYNKYVEEVEAGDARIERSRKALFGGGIVITEESVRELELKRATRDILLESINALKDTGVVQASNNKLSKEEVKEKEKLRKEEERLEIQRQKETDEMRKRASLALADETSKIRLRQQYAEEELQASPAFKKLDKKEQDAIIQEGRDLSQAQIDAIISNRQENEQKSQEALKKILTFEPKSAKEIADSHTPPKPEGYDESIQATKDLEEKKKNIRIDIAMQTFDLLSALNARYTQSQTQQLQEQLQQGVISQEAYEAQMRKIKRRQAVIDKAGALFNIGLNTAVNATDKPALAPLIIAFGAVQAATVIASPIPYNKGTKKVPMVRGAVRGKDSVHAILTPNERVVPEDINSQPGYSALMDLAHDRKISDKEAGFIAKLATGGVYAGQQSSDIDYNQLGKSIAKYIPHTDVRIDHNGIAVITDRSHANMNRLKTRL